MKLKKQINLIDYVDDVPDFPQKGVMFRDISPLLKDPDAFAHCIWELTKNVQWSDVIVWLDARGFIFASVIAHKLGIPLVMIRKSGKLPWETLSKKYDLEYASQEFEIQKSSIEPGQKIALIDDVLATWWSMKAACDLVEELWAEVSGVHFVLELAFLKGSELLQDYEKKSLIIYN